MKKIVVKAISAAAVIAAMLLCGAVCNAGKSVGYAVSLKSPANSAKVNIANDTVKDWWVSYEPYISSFNDEVKELTKPEPVTLRWSGKKGYRYKVYISTDSGFKNKTKYTTKKNSLKLYNLLRSQKYYWKVTGTKGEKRIKSRSRRFKTTDMSRIIRASGVENIRDIGGFKASGDTRTRQGLVYRSAELDDIKKSGINVLKKDLKIKTELDLRKEGEGSAGGKSPAVKNYVNIKGSEYLEIFEDGEERERFAEAVRLFADRGNYPILVHCVYGRDRTGTLVFVLNGLLGVSRKNLWRDYELSYMTGCGSSIVSERISEFETFYKAMASYADADKPLAYNIERYLLDSGITADEIKSIKSILT